MNKNALPGVFIYIPGLIGLIINKAMKKILTILFLTVSILGMRGETVSQKQAQGLAHSFFNEAYGRVTAPPKLVYNGRKLTTQRLFTPFYIYNTGLGGFVIISAENKAYPILGFSLKESFDPDNMGDVETALLKSYAKEIELVRYDVQPVDGAIKAWQNYPEYVDNILRSKYQATDPNITTVEAEELLETAMERDDAIYSDLYTPAQWADMIISEIKEKESAPLLLVEGDKTFPCVIYGHQGDYFRIEMTRRNQWLMRLNATETVSALMVSAVVNPIPLPEVTEDEKPFEAHDMFIAEVEETETARRETAGIGAALMPDGDIPVIKANGAGHFEIILPEEAVLTRVYNISGAMVRQNTFTGTPVVNVDISAEPSGFYFITITGKSGTPYGFKLVR